MLQCPHAIMGSTTHSFFIPPSCTFSLPAYFPPPNLPASVILFHPFPCSACTLYCCAAMPSVRISLYPCSFVTASHIDVRRCSSQRHGGGDVVCQRTPLIPACLTTLSSPRFLSAPAVHTYACSGRTLCAEQLGTLQYTLLRYSLRGKA